MSALLKIAVPDQAQTLEMAAKKFRLTSARFFLIIASTLERR